MNSVKLMNVESVTLSGSVVRLEPLKIDHVEALSHVGLESELWRWIPSPVATIDHMRDYVLKALDEQLQGFALPFVIIDQVSNQVIGCTRYVDIVMSHKRLEIGSTWLTSMYQRTKANTEAKLLLLTYAFEKMDVIRVIFKTDALNEKSRKAILRIGAVEEGIFRKHLITASGRVRDSVYFSIIDTEWPMIKT
ncbi:MAG: GNAT family protein [Alphaproteobacteria bacterium]|nr:GNAT family protein [Alphaproteobacteria bacterium]